MPWLLKSEDDDSDGNDLLFVHVPRCGGTSLTKHYKVREKSLRGRGLYHKIGLTYFFYRYRLLEHANYPFVTWENAYAVLSILIATVVFTVMPLLENDCFGSDSTADPSACRPQKSAYVMWSTALFTMTCSTFVFVAPVMGRNTFVRRVYGFLVGKLLFGFTSGANWLTGCNDVGWLLHLTAEKIIRYGYVSAEQFASVNSFSIVRNPYSRMVSIYMYNRMGPLESFSHFVKEWKKKIKPFSRRGDTDEWNVYCHVLPQYAYTHDRDGKQIVQNIIKQEDLRSLKSDKPKEYLKHLTPVVRKALLDMPHSNKRKRPKPWQEYYDAETMKIVHDMYIRDFDQYGYEHTIPKRPDLPLSIVGKRNPRPPVGWSSWGATYANRDLAEDDASNHIHTPGAELTPEAGDDEEEVEVEGVQFGGDDIENATTESKFSDDDAEKKSFCRELYVMLTSPVQLAVPVFDARTVDDLHYFVALTLRRRCLWLFILALIECIVAGVFMKDLNVECTEYENCQPVSFTIIGLTLHILALFFAALAYLEFDYVPLILATVWTCLCALWSFVTFLLSLFYWEDFPAKERNTDFKVWALVYSVLFMVYYSVYFTTYLRVTKRYAEIQKDEKRYRAASSRSGASSGAGNDPLEVDEEEDQFDAEAGGFLSIQDGRVGDVEMMAARPRKESAYTVFGRRFSSIAKKAYIF